MEKFSCLKVSADMEINSCDNSGKMFAHASAYVFAGGADENFVRRDAKYCLCGLRPAWRVGKYTNRHRRKKTK